MYEIVSPFDLVVVPAEEVRCGWEKCICLGTTQGPEPSKHLCCSLHLAQPSLASR